MQYHTHISHNQSSASNSFVRSASVCIIPGHLRRRSSMTDNETRLIYVRSGKMEIEQIDGTRINIKAGDVFISRVKSKFITSIDCEDYCISFQSLDEQLKYIPALAQPSVHYQLNPSTQEKLIVYFNDLLNELQIKESGYPLALSIRLMQILLLINRSCDTANDIKISSNISKIKPAILEMHNNYAQTMSLNYYADLCNMSLSSFQHTFTKLMNTTPIKYLNKIKLDNSIFLLIESELTISEISDSLGFSEPSYFSNLFKKKYGMSPATYREKYK